MGVVRMNLDRERFVGEQQLQQQGGIGRGRIRALKPDFADRAIDRTCRAPGARIAASPGLAYCLRARVFDRDGDLLSEDGPIRARNRVPATETVVGSLLGVAIRRSGAARNRCKPVHRRHASIINMAIRAPFPRPRSRYSQPWEEIVLITARGWSWQSMKRRR